MSYPIVVGVDGSPAAEQAVMQAIDIAAAKSAPLHLLAVSRDHEPEEIQALEGSLAGAGAKAEASGLTVDTQLRHGDAAEAILALATETGAGLIVVGGGRIGSIVRFLLGSVADDVSHHAPCNVMITAPRPQE